MMNELLVLIGASAPGLERLSSVVVHVHGILLTSTGTTYIFISLYEVEYTYISHDEAACDV